MQLSSNIFAAFNKREVEEENVSRTNQIQK